MEENSHKIALLVATNNATRDAAPNSACAKMNFQNESVIPVWKKKNLKIVKTVALE